MKKSGLIILVIIGIIALGIVLGFVGEPEDTQNIYKNSTQNVNNKENAIANTENENKQAQNIENVEENNVTETTVEEQPKTESDKALDIVKLDWGANLDNVTINVDDKISDGIYMVSVRERNTTKALAFYTVNVTDKTFTKKEMN